MIDYFFLFPNEAAAIADPTVGQFYVTGASSWRKSVCFPGLKIATAQAVVNGISTLTGFWLCIVSTPSNAIWTPPAASALAGHANCVLVLNRDTTLIVSKQLSASGSTSFQFSPMPCGAVYAIPLNQ